MGSSVRQIDLQKSELEKKEIKENKSLDNDKKSEEKKTIESKELLLNRKPFETKQQILKIMMFLRRLKLKLDLQKRRKNHMKRRINRILSKKIQLVVFMEHQIQRNQRKPLK